MLSLDRLIRRNEYWVAHMATDSFGRDRNLQGRAAETSYGRRPKGAISSLGQLRDIGDPYDDRRGISAYQQIAIPGLPVNQTAGFVADPIDEVAAYMAARRPVERQNAPILASSALTEQGSLFPAEDRVPSVLQADGGTPRLARLGYTPVPAGSRVSSTRANPNSGNPRNWSDRGILPLLLAQMSSDPAGVARVLQDPRINRGQVRRGLLRDGRLEPGLGVGKPYPGAFALTAADFPPVRGQDAPTEASWPIEWEAYKDYFGGLARESGRSIDPDATDNDRFGTFTSEDPTLRSPKSEFGYNINPYGTVDVPVLNARGSWDQLSGRNKGQVAVRRIDPTATAYTRSGNPDSPYSSEQTEEVSYGRLMKEAADEAETPVITGYGLKQGNFIPAENLPAEVAQAFSRTGTDMGAFVGLKETANPQRFSSALSSLSTQKSYVPVYQVYEQDSAGNLAPKLVQREEWRPNPTGYGGEVVSVNDELYRLGAPFKGNTELETSLLQPYLGVQTVRTPDRSAPSAISVNRIASIAAEQGYQLYGDREQAALAAATGDAGLAIAPEALDPGKPVYVVRPDGSTTTLIPKLTPFGQPTGSFHITDNYTRTAETGPGPVLSHTGIRRKSEDPTTTLRRAKPGAAEATLGEAAIARPEFREAMMAGTFMEEPNTRNAIADALAPLVASGRIDPAVLTNRLAVAADSPVGSAAARLRGALEDYRSRTGRGVPKSEALAWAASLAEQASRRLPPGSAPIGPNAVLRAAAAMRNEAPARPLFAEGSNAQRLLQEAITELKQRGVATDVNRPVIGGVTPLSPEEIARARDLQVIANEDEIRRASMMEAEGEPQGGITGGDDYAYDFDGGEIPESGSRPAYGSGYSYEQVGTDPWVTKFKALAAKQAGNRTMDSAAMYSSPSWSSQAQADLLVDAAMRASAPSRDGTPGTAPTKEIQRLMFGGPVDASVGARVPNSSPTVTDTKPRTTPRGGVVDESEVVRQWLSTPEARQYLASRRDAPPSLGRPTAAEVRSRYRQPEAGMRNIDFDAYSKALGLYDDPAVQDAAMAYQAERLQKMSQRVQQAENQAAADTAAAVPMKGATVTPNQSMFNAPAPQPQNTDVSEYQANRDRLIRQGFRAARGGQFL